VGCRVHQTSSSSFSVGSSRIGLISGTDEGRSGLVRVDRDQQKDARKLLRVCVDISMSRKGEC